MRISNIHVPKTIKASVLTLPFMFVPSMLRGQLNNTQQDVFVKTTEQINQQEADSISIAPIVQIGNRFEHVAAVVDISEKKLYHYDLNTTLMGIYPIATGKSSTPTKTGIRRVSGIEDYPYNTAPKATKRYKNPNDYGTKLVRLDAIDPETGEIIPGNGQFIHGTFKPESIGKSVSKGCVRLKNEDVEELTLRLYENQYILIKE